MKKTMLAAIKVAKAKGRQKRGRRPVLQPQDPKDLRGAKGALLKEAIAAVLEEDLSDNEGVGARHSIRIGADS